MSSNSLDCNDCCSKNSRLRQKPFGERNAITFPSATEHDDGTNPANSETTAKSEIAVIFASAGDRGTLKCKRLNCVAEIVRVQNIETAPDDLSASI